MAGMVAKEHRNCEVGYPIPCGKLAHFQSFEGRGAPPTAACYAHIFQLASGPDRVVGLTQLGKDALSVWRDPGRATDVEVERLRLAFAEEARPAPHGPCCTHLGAWDGYLLFVCGRAEAKVGGPLYQLIAVGPGGEKFCALGRTSVLRDKALAEADRRAQLVVGIPRAL